jgi:hypothetical protein
VCNFSSAAEGAAAASLAASEWERENPVQVKPRPESCFYGVYARGKQWIAQMTHNSKTHYPGRFDTKQEAPWCVAMGSTASSRSIANDSSMDIFAPTELQMQVSYHQVRDQGRRAS